MQKRHYIALLIAPAVVPLCVAAVSLVSLNLNAIVVLGPILGFSYTAAALLGLPAMFILSRCGKNSLLDYCIAGLVVGVASALLLSSHWGWSGTRNFVFLAALCSLFSLAASLATWLIAEWCLTSARKGRSATRPALGPQRR